MEDQPRSGRHSTCRNDENLAKDRNAINTVRRWTIDEISVINGLSWSSCQRMLTEDMNMKCFSAKFVPRLLTEDKKKHSFEFIAVINQLDAQNFCFTISLFHAFTCFEHMYSSSGGLNCITQPVVSSRSVGGHPVHRTAAYRV